MAGMLCGEWAWHAGTQCSSSSCYVRVNNTWGYIYIHILISFLKVKLTLFVCVCVCPCRCSATRPQSGGPGS